MLKQTKRFTWAEASLVWMAEKPTVTSPNSNIGWAQARTSQTIDILHTENILHKIPCSHVTVYWEITRSQLSFTLNKNEAVSATSLISTSKN